MSRTRHSDNQFALDLGEDNPMTGQSEQNLAVEKPDPLASLADTEALLQHWQQAEWIRPLDTGFARLIRDLSQEQGETPEPLVLLLAALASHQVGRGHVCIDLATLIDNSNHVLALPPEDARISAAPAPDLSLIHI